MQPTDSDDLLSLLPAERPDWFSILPPDQAYDRGKTYLFFEGCGWGPEDAWDAAMSPDPLMIGVIKRLAEVVPDEAIREAIVARRAPEPNPALLAFHAAALNSFWKPAPSRIAINIGSRR